MSKSKRAAADRALDRELRYLAMQIAITLPETKTSAARALRYAGFAYRNFLHARRPGVKAWAANGKKKSRGRRSV